MAENKKLVPKRRFKELQNAGDWEHGTIVKFGNFYYGKSAPKWSVTVDATIPCARYGELYTKYREKIDTIYSYTNIPKENLKFSTGKEVLVPRVGEDPLDFANCSWLSIPGVAIGEMISVYNTEQNPLFTAYMFNALFKHEFAKRVEGGNVSNLYYRYLENIPVSYPSLKEQEKISSFFDNLSNLITLHQRKLEKTKALKSAYLSEMFPQEGESVPKRRFKGFTDEWERRKLGEILTCIPFKQYLKRPEQEGKYEIIQQGNEPIIGYANGNAYTDFNDVAIFGDHTLSLYKPKSPFFVATDGVRIIKGNDSMNGNYLYSLLEKYKPQSEGYKRYFSILSDKECYTTNNLAEQTQIGTFFAHLDNLINHHQRKLQKLQDIKKAYLNAMFI